MSTADLCPNGYRYVEVKYGVDEFVVYLANSGEDADAALTGSPTGSGLTLDRLRASDHLTVSRTFFPPDNFNLLFIRLIVHGPPSVTIVVDSAQDPHRETVGLLTCYVALPCRRPHYALRLVCLSVCLPIPYLAPTVEGTTTTFTL